MSLALAPVFFFAEAPGMFLEVVFCLPSVIYLSRLAEQTGAGLGHVAGVIES